MRVLTVVACLSVGTAGLAGGPAAPGVEVVALPGGGIQPQAVVDDDGIMHVLYFSGTPAAGDLFYIARRPGAASFSQPVRVNSVPGSAIATGSVRGGQLAVGRNGWIHVAWNAARAIERGGEKVTPMWYARLAATAPAFEAQRAIGTHTRHLDGGGSVAADARGSVYVTWHAAGPVDGEERRSVYVAASRDDGARFDADKTVLHTGGVCGCCGLRSLADARGRLHLLYRAATASVHRDATWLIVQGGTAGPPIKLHAWELPACPMTTFAMAKAGDGVAAAWETAQQIYVSTLDPGRRTFSAVTPVSGAAGNAPRKHPSIAVNADGVRLIAWTEGTAWARGGTLAWQLQDAAGKVLASQSDGGPVPVWGLVAAVARRDGSFVIIR